MEGCRRAEDRAIEHWLRQCTSTKIQSDFLIQVERARNNLELLTLRLATNDPVSALRLVCQHLVKLSPVLAKNARALTATLAPLVLCAAKQIPVSQETSSVCVGLEDPDFQKWVCFRALGFASSSPLEVLCGLESSFLEHLGIAPPLCTFLSFAKLHKPVETALQQALARAFRICGLDPDLNMDTNIGAHDDDHRREQVEKHLKLALKDNSEKYMGVQLLCEVETQLCLDLGVSSFGQLGLGSSFIQFCSKHRSGLPLSGISAGKESADEADLVHAICQKSKELGTEGYREMIKVACLSHFGRILPSCLLEDESAARPHTAYPNSASYLALGTYLSTGVNSCAKNASSLNSHEDSVAERKQLAARAIQSVDYLADLSINTLWSVLFEPQLGSIKSFLSEREIPFLEVSHGVFWRLPSQSEATLTAFGGSLRALDARHAVALVLAQCVSARASDSAPLQLWSQQVASWVNAQTDKDDVIRFSLRTLALTPRILQAAVRNSTICALLSLCRCGLPSSWLRFLRCQMPSNVSWKVVTAWSNGPLFAGWVWSSVCLSGCKASYRGRNKKPLLLLNFQLWTWTLSMNIFPHQ